MILFTMEFTIALFSRFLTIVNAIVNEFIVFYGVFEQFTISLFTISIFWFWGNYLAETFWNSQGFFGAISRRLSETRKAFSEQSRGDFSLPNRQNEIVGNTPPDCKKTEKWIVK